MSVSHYLLLVEEPSMEAFLRALLPRLLPATRTFEIFPFQGKADLLNRLGSRLRAYAIWLPADWRIAVVVDRDDDDCRELKRVLERTAAGAGLISRSRAGKQRWQLVNRIAVEELEAWYFADWQAVREAFPRVPATVAKAASYRDPDSIRGGTWEAFERVLQRHGYYKSGLPKIDVARTLGGLIDPSRSRSRSFRALREALGDE